MRRTLALSRIRTSKVGICALPYLAESQWGVHVNPAMGDIEYKGLRRHLTPTCFKALTHLMDSEIVTKQELYEALTGLPDGDSTYVRVYISHLRRLLKGFPLRIDTYSGYGYALRKT